VNFGFFFIFCIFFTLLGVGFYYYQFTVLLPLYLFFLWVLTTCNFRWAPDRCQLHLLCALMRAVFLAAIQRGSLRLRSLLLFFAQLPPLVELLAALSWTVALAVVIAWVCRSFRFSSSFFFRLLAAGSIRCWRLCRGLWFYW